jgi:uncharacterized protein (UPF0332 family)
MTLSAEDKKQLIKYRIDQSRECIEEVAFLIYNKKLKTAINRIYYGMFYSLLALGLKYEFETSKHFQLLGWFNKTFIKTEKLDKIYGQIVNKSYTLILPSGRSPRFARG